MDAKNKNTTEQTNQNSCFQYSYFSVRIFTTSDPISNPLKTFAKLFNANFSLQYHHALLYRYLSVLILFCSILPHPTLSYPILSFLFYFFCIILSDPRLFDSLQLTQQPQKLWAIMKRWTGWRLCSQTFGFRVGRNYEKCTSYCKIGQTRDVRDQGVMERHMWQ